MQEIVHNFVLLFRDVKCLNIFMTKTDLLKLGDFGISKLLESSSEMAETVSIYFFHVNVDLTLPLKYVLVQKPKAQFVQFVFHDDLV